MRKTSEVSAPRSIAMAEFYLMSSQYKTPLLTDLWSSYIFSCSLLSSPRTSYLAMLCSLLHLPKIQCSNNNFLDSYLFSVQLTMSNSTADTGLQPHRLILYFPQNIFRRLLFFRISSEKVVKCFLFENSSSRNPFSQMAFKPGARIGHFGQFVKIIQKILKMF